VGAAFTACYRRFTNLKLCRLEAADSMAPLNYCNVCSRSTATTTRANYGSISLGSSSAAMVPAVIETPQRC